ncbi:MAG: hemin uptake protein HemP [Patescibacteria group bacterium]|nr:hemin uptake protein HemP [Patescibacteria group bacterium]
MRCPETPREQPDECARAVGSEGVLSVPSETLLAGRRELRIVHGDEVYRLVLTRNNRLILHK